MTFEGEARMMGLCMVCRHATHDFPRDVEHEQRHAGGWHTCEVDGQFRQCKPLCRDFGMADGVQASY